MGPLDQLSDHANAAKARRQNLPTLLTETTSQCTPIATVLMKNPVGTFRGPMIRSPTTPLRTTILEQFLADTYEADALTETSPQPPLTLASAGISDTLTTPNTMVPWCYIMGSPPETNSDCFSPVLRTGSAEQQPGQEIHSGISFGSEEEPMSASSIKSIQSTKSFPAWLPTLGLIFRPRIGPESVEGQIQQQNDAAAQTESNLEMPAVMPMPCSPTWTECTFLEEEFAAAIPVPVTKTTRFRRNSFPQLLRKSKDHPKVLPTLPTPDQKGHPHPLRSAPFEGLALSSNQEEQAEIVSPPPPPPAPTENSFENQLPQVKNCIEPSPVLPDVRIRSIDPLPVPTQPSFSKELPASPARSKPVPIDTISPRETIVSGKGKTLQLRPPEQLTERFDTGSPISSNNNEPQPPPTAETCTTKPSKVVRFVVVDSPPKNTDFKPQPTPYPWPTRTFGGTTITSILSPIAGEFSPSSPFPEGENSKPTMADALLDRTTPRGRTEQRLEKVGRLTRSVSPKNKRIEEPVGPATLPNTVFECQRAPTRSPVTSDKKIILRTYFNSNKAAIH